MITSLFLLCSKFVPPKIIDNKISYLLKHAGSKDDERMWIGKRILLAFMVSGILFLSPYTIFPILKIFTGINLQFELSILLLIMIIAGILSFIGTMTMFYLHLAYVIDGRKKMVEDILPDFLYLVGNNLKSGMTPFYAFRSAIRPEFGPLSEEINLATKKSLGINSFSESLRTIGKRIDSKLLIDTTRFFSHALRSGGKLAELVETTAKNIKQMNHLRMELINSTRMYILFIIFVVVIASPMLLAVSVQFLEILTNVQEETSEFSSGGAPRGAITMDNALTVTPKFMEIIAYVIIISNSFLAGIFVGVIGGGKIRDGLKFTPVLLIAGLILFRIFLVGVGTVVGGIA